MSGNVLLVVYLVVIAALSLCGGWLPSWLALSHRRLQLALSFVGGLMLGVSIFHLLPHSVNATGSVDDSVFWVMVGLLVMFFLERWLSFHHHEPPPAEEHDHHHHDHPPEAHDHEHPAPEQLGPFGWLGAALGLTLHTIIDGIGLAASIELEKSTEAPLAGLGVFLVIALHKPFDALSICTLMVSTGWSAWARNVVNLFFAGMVSVGAVVFYLGIQQTDLAQMYVVGCALGVAAGTFLFISLGDLLPELHFHSHDRWKLSGMLLLGIALAYGIGFLEHSGHDHHHHESPYNHESHQH